MRSGRSMRSARESHTCGVMQFWLASQTSVAASLASTCHSEPPRLPTCTRLTQGGAPRSTFF